MTTNVVICNGRRKSSMRVLPCEAKHSSIPSSVLPIVVCVCHLCPPPPPPPPPLTRSPWVAHEIF